MKIHKTKVTDITHITDFDKLPKNDLIRSKHNFGVSVHRKEQRKFFDIDGKRYYVILNIDGTIDSIISFSVRSLIPYCLTMEDLLKDAKFYYSDAFDLLGLSLPKFKEGDIVKFIDRDEIAMIREISVGFRHQCGIYKMKDGKITGSQAWFNESKFEIHQPISAHSWQLIHNYKFTPNI